jgi:hypothetical protein
LNPGAVAIKLKTWRVLPMHCRFRANESLA